MGIRTPGLTGAIRALYQLSYIPSGCIYLIPDHPLLGQTRLYKFSNSHKSRLRTSAPERVYKSSREVFISVGISLGHSFSWMGGLSVRIPSDREFFAWGCFDWLVKLKGEPNDKEI